MNRLNSKEKKESLKLDFKGHLHPFVYFYANISSVSLFLCPLKAKNHKINL